MKKLIFMLIIALISVALTSCQWFNRTFANSQQKDSPPQETAYWCKRELHKAIVTHKSNGPHAWHRVWFRIDGRSHDSFENNVDCYKDVAVGDSLLVEEVFSSVLHYYNICKITH